MPIHMTEADLKRYGLYDVLVAEGQIAPTSAPDKPTLADTPQPVLAPQPTTSTYALLRAFLDASTAAYGTPQVRIVPGGYAIRLGDTLAVGVTITQTDTTMVSYNARATDGRWFVLEARRMTKLAPRELSLFVTRKEL